MRPHEPAQKGGKRAAAQARLYFFCPAPLTFSLQSVILNLADNL